MTGLRALHHGVGAAGSMEQGNCMQTVGTVGTGRCCRSVILAAQALLMGVALAACSPTETTGTASGSSSGGNQTQSSSANQNASSGNTSSGGVECPAVVCTLACQWGFASG